MTSRLESYISVCQRVNASSVKVDESHKKCFGDDKDHSKYIVIYYQVRRQGILVNPPHGSDGSYCLSRFSWFLYCMQRSTRTSLNTIYSDVRSHGSYVGSIRH